jgi:hypothetical protein
VPDADDLDRQSKWKSQGMYGRWEKTQAVLKRMTG